MTRALSFHGAIFAALLLAGCSLLPGGDDSADDAIPEAAKASAAQEGAGEGAGGNGDAAAAGIGTPNADRVATLGLLNKRNNLTQDVTLKTGESRRLGNVIIKLESCDRSLPWEAQKEEGAFVQVFVNERGRPDQDPKWRTVFSGWLFKNSPSINVVEHPIYDVWVKDCAMNFPGEETPLPDDASARSAAKPSGSASGESASE